MLLLRLALEKRTHDANSGCNSEKYDSNGNFSFAFDILYVLGGLAGAN
jgi:hypothetical protein